MGKFKVTRGTWTCWSQETKQANFELEDKILRFTGDDNGIPCIDILDLPEPGSWGYGKIISTHYIKFEDDLIDFADSLT